MNRHSFTSFNIKRTVGEVSQLLGCQEEFITSSFDFRKSTDTRVVTPEGTVCTRVRYFEHYQQDHATITQQRTELPMSEVLKTWMQNVKKYPPSEIFFQQTGPKSEKAEKRCKLICEDLYRFSFPEGQENLLNELGAAYREFEVLTTLGYDDLKEGRILEVGAKLQYYMREVCNALEAMHKKDQLLNDYYKSWKVKYQDLSREVSKLTMEFI